MHRRATQSTGNTSFHPVLGASAERFMSVPCGCRSGRKRKQTAKALAGGPVESGTAARARQMLAAAETAHTAQPATAEHDTETL